MPRAELGMVSTDIEHSFVGQPFNFNLDLGVGVRYFVARNLSLSLEYRYQHISNANIGRNITLASTRMGRSWASRTSSDRLTLFGLFLSCGGVFLLLADHRRDGLQLIAFARLMSFTPCVLRPASRMSFTKMRTIWPAGRDQHDFVGVPHGQRAHDAPVFSLAFMVMMPLPPRDCRR